MEELKNIELFLLDMDGTIYFEDKLIDGAKEFIDRLILNHKQYVFMSNNSSVSKMIYLEKMRKLGIPCSEDNLFSSGMAMGVYLKTYAPDKKVFLVGTKALEKELLSYGVNLVDKDADIVVVGYDRELNYQKLETACYLLDNGATFLATNPDLVYPLKGNRYLPDCGSICAMITNATKKVPTYIGKPNPYMVDLLSEKFNVEKSKIAIIGDRLYTDIKTGINSGIISICVLSGETTSDLIETSDVKPTFVFNSIKDVIDLI